MANVQHAIVRDDVKARQKLIHVVDGGIAFNTLERAFPNAYGLHYVEDGNEIALDVDANNNKFFLPSVDLNCTIFHIDFKSVDSNSGYDPDRIIETLSSDVSKDLTIADNLAISVANRCSKYLFYSKLVGFNENKPVYDPGENNKFLFTVFSKTCAATAKHCLRAVQNDSQYRDAKIGDTFEITACADPQKSLLVKVKYFSSRLDFAIVEVVSENFTSYPAIDTPERGRRGVCLGLPYFEAVDGGNIVETQAKEREPVPFSVEIAALDVPVPGMFAGSCGLTHGYSGAGLFRIYGNTDLLMGICCRGRIPPEDWVSTWSRSNWLHRRSLAYYISSAIINFAIEEQEEPVIKKSKPSDVEKPTE